MMLSIEKLELCCLRSLLACAALCGVLLPSALGQQLPRDFQVDPGFLGSVPSGKPTPEVLELSLLDALARGLKYNLGLVESTAGNRVRRAERLLALSRLLPAIEIRPSVAEQQVNLAALGFHGFPGVPGVVGPFTVYDARAYFSQSVLDLQSLRQYRAGAELVRAGELSYRDARDQVTLIVTGLYLQAIAAGARIDAAKAQVATADALYRLASDRKQAGVVAGIDVLRAQVQLQEQQQRLIAAEGDLERQKLTLARAIGLPPGQEYRVADVIPYDPVSPTLSLEETLAAAYRQRADYQSAQAVVRAAELQKSAASAARLPSISLDANYGTNGQNPTQLHGSFTVMGSINIPVYLGGRVRAEVERLDAVLEQRRAELDNLRGRIDQDVRQAFIDLRTAARQVEVSRSNLDLARQQLTQSQDRFSAGVTNNLEVVQAQQAVAAAQEAQIASLYSFNAAKALLARARGDAEEAVKEYLQRKP